MTSASTISQDIFRAYDIRGIVGDTLTPEVVFLIGRAYAAEALMHQQKEVVVARDGRLSGPSLIQALKEGLMAGGCHVIDVGAVPTPLLYFATHILSTQSGIMLTGSHNPPDYNGLKMIIAGHTLAEETIQTLYQRIIKQDFSQGQGSSQEISVIDNYIAKILETITLNRSLKIIVDAGNGIAGKIAPRLYKQLGCEVIELFCEVDGHFPNHHPDPSVPHNLHDLIHAVKNHQADVGLAFDGDGDRLGVVTNQGEIIWPDRQLMLYAQDILSRQSGATIIYDVKCTKHLAENIKSHSGQPLMWKTGHSLIKQKMREIGAALGGEMSGHIFFKERWYGFDDGLYTGARLLEILAHDKRTSSELFKTFPDSINTPELKLPVNPEQRHLIIEGMKKASEFSRANIISIDGVRVEFADGWGLIRASNTTPHLIMRFEANNEHALITIQNQFKHALLALDSTLSLPF